MKILVTGATGLIGAHAVARLQAAGFAVRILVRDPRKVVGVLAPLGLGPEDVEIVVGDLADAGRLRDALAGAAGLLHCAGLFSPERRDEARLVDTNVEGTRRVLEAARTAGVTRAVHVSSMLALFPPRGERMSAHDSVSSPNSMYAKTKASAERIARALQARMPLSIVYPAAVHGPKDPTFSIGPRLVANALRDARVLVTEGGLAITDVRDLSACLVAIFEGRTEETRLMAPSFYLRHDDYHGLLESLTGRSLAARRVPGALLRGLGRLGDVAQRFGRSVQLTHEAAEVLTRSVPLDDREARRLLGRDAIGAEESFRDLIRWMVEVGHLAPRDAGHAALGRPRDAHRTRTVR